MTTPARQALALPALLLLLGVFAGCHNPDAANTTPASTSTRSPQNAGELPAPPPPSSTSQAPISVQPTPEKTLEAFAQLYVNWTYRTLNTNQRTLAAMAVGPARLAERQAAAASHADTTITRSRIYNTGQIVSIAPDRARAKTWVLVTREQTGGDSQYEGLHATYHVTLAKVASVPSGYAIEQWLPQT